jgi:vacuolar protein sorting-associated protein 41
MKRALYLIIDRLGDVKKAIDFAKLQDDPDLWEDLLNYSMDKPSFIRGLLEQVGTAINPITLVRRIPEGLEIEGLREGLKHIMKEHEIQYSISSGVARVLESEVAAAQTELRNGQRKAIKFEVDFGSPKHIDVEVKDVATAPVNPAKPSELDDNLNEPGPLVKPVTVDEQPDHSHKVPQAGHCAKCHEAFTEFEAETLVGFACGHVFHLTHLLEAIYPGKGKGVDVSFGMDFEGRGRRYAVGPKVTHARLLKDRIQGGCPVCITKEGIV